MPTALLKRRLIFVTGKGGVGKSTLALALALRAADTGRRTIVADFDNERVGGEADAARSYGAADEHEVWDGVFRISVDPSAAMLEYLTVKVGGAVGGLLGHSHVFNAFAMAAPGMRELLGLGKVWELAQPQRRTPGAAPYDLVIVDAPASGHGAALLGTPATFAEIAKVGPIAHQARTIAATLADRERTGYLAVSTPEEAAITEALQLDDALARQHLALDAVVLNACHPDRFDAADVATLQALAPAPPVALALRAHARARSEAEQEGRLRERFATRVRRLPFLYDVELGREQLELLGAELGEL